MSGKLSLIFPSRDERFLIPSIHDAFRNARGEFEVVTVIDSNKWPEGWKEVTDKYPNLYTIFHGQSRGMRAAINSGAGSAISRGAKYIAKFDAHCSFSEGFDEVLKSACEPNWIVVPRRGRLDPENWYETELNKPPIDYHYLSFPDDPDDFGGPGLNGKPWLERAVERAQYELDEEMSSQGSGWFMYAAYFTELELMDESSYGPFWNEFQEIGLKCWLSGGRVMVNKKAKYLHLHKGKKYGRGYHLPESWLQQGRTHANLWVFNEAWPKQTLPFEWLIDHFWPVPTWSENWREVLYATRRPRDVVSMVGSGGTVPTVHDTKSISHGLIVHAAHYGISDTEFLDVQHHLQSLVRDNSLDIIVNNSTITPGGNPFRGKKKRLVVEYSIDGGEPVTCTVEEKDWLIIGPVKEQWLKVQAHNTATEVAYKVTFDPPLELEVANEIVQQPPMTAAALNDYLIRRFQVSPQRLRGPMPIELRDFHRNDLAQLFAELGFKRGAEIGVAEGNYSEVLLKANPECELLLVDSWHAYSENPQNKTKEKHEHAYNEVLRKVDKYLHVRIHKDYSMNAVRDVNYGELDFCYIDAHHSFDFVMSDLIEWSKRVRNGGLVCGDDYIHLDEKRWGAGPVEAVQAYVNAHRIAVWWLFAGHKSVDYMWVRP